MKDYAEGRITEIRNNNRIFYNASIPAIVCKPGLKKCIPINLLVDTGANNSMISYKTGNDLGLDSPGKYDKKHFAKDANGRDVPYIKRKIDLTIGNIEKKNIEVCWCTTPKVKDDFLGMDFFDKYKFIVNGKTKKIFITKHDFCVKCSK